MKSGTCGKTDRYADSDQVQNSKILIIGASTGGLSLAIKIRRLSENARIVILEREQSPSYSRLPALFNVDECLDAGDDCESIDGVKWQQLMNIDMRLGEEVLSVDRELKSVVVKSLATGSVYRETYDKLVLVTGSKASDLNVIRNAGTPIFSLQHPSGNKRLIDYLRINACQHAAVIGAGFAGLAILEKLRSLNIQISLIESANQVLNNWDCEMAAVVKSHLHDNGVHLYLDEKVIKINSAKIVLGSGRELIPDVIIVAAGMATNVELAQMCGLTIGAQGGILVNRYLETQDSDIYAIGDAIEVPDSLLGISLWSPSDSAVQKQATVVAENFTGKKLEYKTPHYSAKVNVFSLTAAITGCSEKQLQRQRIAYEKVYAELTSQAAGDSNSRTLMVKLLFTPEQGRILGAQFVGSEMADRYVDIFATAIQSQMSAHELANLELSNSAMNSTGNEPVSSIGLAAQNILQRRVHQIHWHEVEMSLMCGSIMLDVRSVEEFHAGALPGAINMPISQLAQRIDELSRNENIVVYCNNGKKSNLAYQMLSQRGFSRIKYLSGGYNVYSMSKLHQVFLRPIANYPGSPHRKTRSTFKRRGSNARIQQEQGSNVNLNAINPDKGHSVLEINTSGLICPEPILKLAKAMGNVAKGEIVRVISTDNSFAANVKSWCDRKGHQLLSIHNNDSQVCIELQKNRRQI